MDDKAIIEDGICGSITVSHGSPGPQMADDAIQSRAKTPLKHGSGTIFRHLTKDQASGRHQALRPWRTATGNRSVDKLKGTTERTTLDIGQRLTGSRLDDVLMAGSARVRSRSGQRKKSRNCQGLVRLVASKPADKRTPAETNEFSIIGCRLRTSPTRNARETTELEINRMLSSSRYGRAGHDRTATARHGLHSEPR